MKHIKPTAICEAFRSFHPFQVFTWFLFVSLFSVSCVTTVGPFIALPNIPPSKVQDGDVLSLILSVKSFRDVRIVSETSSTMQEGVRRVSPEGDVSQIVTAAFSEALRARGTSVDSSAPTTIQGEIRSWNAETRGSSVGELKSEASIYIEVITSGTRTFSGVYQGSRSSQFPVVTSSDIQDSLGFAMEQAIDQALIDSSLRRALSSR